MENPTNIKWATSWETLFMPYANKGAVQPAHVRAFVFRCLDSIIPILAKFKLSRLYLASVAEQTGLCLTWYNPLPPPTHHTQTKTGFLLTWLKYPPCKIIICSCLISVFALIGFIFIILLLFGSGGFGGSRERGTTIIRGNFSVSINEPPHDKTNKVACAPSEDSDQPGHPPSLIRVFAVHMKKHWALSYLLIAQRRLWSDWADAQADLSSLGA